MATITFFEKTGCSGNARQKKLLADSGHEVVARDLRHRHWTNTELLNFLAGMPVSNWFNRSAPAIKSGEIVPEELDQTTALALLRDNPLLIRRPLLEVGDERKVGFDAKAIMDWIGLTHIPDGDMEACQHTVTVSTTYFVRSEGGSAYPCQFDTVIVNADGCNLG
jgi:nitrogenase-associated protein